MHEHDLEAARSARRGSRIVLNPGVLLAGSWALVAIAAVAILALVHAIVS
jgi:hypothetical protein